jgi:hypothetical protein
MKIRWDGFFNKFFRFEGASIKIPPTFTRYFVHKKRRSYRIHRYLNLNPLFL